jgi:hypothetical protein
VQNGFQLQIVGLTATRELTGATVTFQPSPGTTIQNSQATFALSGIATTWFRDPASGAFGGQFQLTLPFTFQGNVSLSSASVILTNSAGDSSVSSANY